MSYLVPVEYLIKLAVKKGIKKQTTREWREIIQDQILERHDHMIRKIHNTKLSLEDFGSLKVPQSMLASAIKCWGDSEPRRP